MAVRERVVSATSRAATGSSAQSGATCNCSRSMRAPRPAFFRAWASSSADMSTAQALRTSTYRWGEAPAASPSERCRAHRGPPRTASPLAVKRASSVALTPAESTFEPAVTIGHHPIDVLGISGSDGATDRIDRLARVGRNLHQLCGQSQSPKGLLKIAPPQGRVHAQPLRWRAPPDRRSRYFIGGGGGSLDLGLVHDQARAYPNAFRPALCGVLPRTAIDGRLLASFALVGVRGLGGAPGGRRAQVDQSFRDE